MFNLDSTIISSRGSCWKFINWIANNADNGQPTHPCIGHRHKLLLLTGYGWVDKKQPLLKVCYLLWKHHVKMCFCILNAIYVTGGKKQLCWDIKAANVVCPFSFEMCELVKPCWNLFHSFIKEKKNILFFCTFWKYYGKKVSSFLPSIFVVIWIWRV